MTTHVFIVTEDTFPTHLEYMFAGTGAGEDAHENIGMITDVSGCRIGDKVIFYLTQHREEDGKFFGVFEVTSNPLWQRNGDYLYDKLGKRLTNRVLIKPFEIYSEGVTEWDALDNLENLPNGKESPANEMIWSLIYRKLEGKRGCTPIFDYEYEQILDLIKKVNENKKLQNVHNYKFVNENIEELDNKSIKYDTAKITKNDIPLLDGIDESITYSPEEKIVKAKRGEIRYKGKYKNRVILKTQSKCEEELEYFFIKNIGLDDRINEITGDTKNLVFWGSQIFAGVGKRRIDVLTISKHGEIRIIELKDEEFSDYQLAQIKKYIKWVEQYVRKPKEKMIQPLLVVNEFDNSKKQTIDDFNKTIKPHKDLVIYTWHVQEGKIVFNKVV